MRSDSYSLHRNILVAFLVLVGSAVADDSIQQLPNNRWLSSRDFVFDTTTTSNNVAPEIEGTELEFGQQRDTRVVHRKGNRERKAVKRKRKLKKVHDTNRHDNHNHEQYRNDGSHNHHIAKNNHHTGEHDKHEHTQHNENHIDAINIDADFMGHILRRKSSQQSMHYRGSKKPTSKPSKQPASVPASGTDDRNNNNFPTVAITDFPTASVASEPVQSSSCPITLSKSVSLLDDLTLYYEVTNGDNLCIRLEYDNEGWIGLGFSSSEGRMVGSTAVIGVPDEKEPAYYSLNGMADSMITLLSDETVKEATLLQRDGLTIMTFSKSLVNDEHISLGENTFIYAASTSNHFGYHNQRGSVTLYLTP